MSFCRCSPLQIRCPVSKARKISQVNVKNIKVASLSGVENDIGSSGFQLFRATALFYFLNSDSMFISLNDDIFLKK